MSELEKKLAEIADKDKERRLIEATMLILSDMTPKEMKDIGNEEFFTKLATNFVKANTEDDILTFITHHAAMRLSKMFMK